MHLSEECEACQRAIQNMEICNIGPMFETVQALISNLKHGDHEIHGFDDFSGFEMCILEKSVIAGQKISTQFTSTMYVFGDTVLCLGGKCQEHPAAARILENERVRYFVGSPEYQQYYNITGMPMEFV